MITGSTEIAKLSTHHVGIAYLIKFEFTSGTVYYTNFDKAIDWDGHTWTPTNVTPQVSPLKETATLASQDLNISLSPVSEETVSMALGAPEEYRGRACTIYMAVLDDTLKLLGTPKIRWSGFMDSIQVATEVTDDGVAGAVNIKCENGTNSLSRIKTYRMNNMQQQLRVPGDKGFEYIEKLISEPITWLSVKFQRT